MALLHMKGVHFAYPGIPRESMALQGVDLEVEAGEWIAVVGANGSGKSTLARHINGLLLPVEGSVLVGGADTRAAALLPGIRRQVGMVFQQPESQFVATIVEEDVAFGLENHRVPRDEMQKRVKATLERLGIAHLAHRPPHLLSGGQKQLVALAGVLAVGPRLIVLDEATAMLDPAARLRIRELVAAEHRAGLTVVWITHDMEEAALAQRIAALDRGRLAFDGSPASFFANRPRLQALGLEPTPSLRLADRLRGRLGSLPADLLHLEDLLAHLPRPDQRNTPSWRETPATRSQAGQPDRPQGLVRIQGLEHAYQAGTPFAQTALRGVDLNVSEGDFLTVAGAAGSGKSTLIQHLNGLLLPQAGEVEVAGLALHQPGADLRQLRRRVGLVFQQPENQLFEQLVGDDIAFGPRRQGLTGAALRERVRWAMELTGLDFETFKDRPTFALSGGERRRAALAGVLALKPRLLVLDEPTAGLDPAGREQLLQRLISLRDAGVTLILVTHDLENVAFKADRIFVLAEGRGVADATPAKLLAGENATADWGLAAPARMRVAAALRALGWTQVVRLLGEDTPREGGGNLAVSL